MRYVFLAIVLCGALIMGGMRIWAHRLDADFSGSYACCTQEEVARFHQQFWSKFFVGATLSLAGCFGLSVILATEETLRAGRGACGASVVLFFTDFAANGIHNWSGSTGFTIAVVVFCAGAMLQAVGYLRMGWTKLRHRRSGQ